MATTISSQDLLVRKESHLGFVRALEPDQSLIYPRISPIQNVNSDNVIWDIAQPQINTLASARAEDAESKLSQKDHFMGYGSASVVDWAIKDFYSASDITRYRDTQYLANTATLPQSLSTDAQEFQKKLATDTQRRKKALDNRLEEIVVDSLVLGTYTYNDGDMIFTIDWNRPGAQTDVAAATPWNSATGAHDPLADLVTGQDYMYDNYYIQMGTLILSTKAARTLVKSTKFMMTTNNAVLGSGGALSPTDIQYLVGNFGTSAAQQIISGATGLNVIIYDGAVWDRTLGSNADPTWSRFMPEDTAILLPDVPSTQGLLGTEIGFSKTLTSPHPEGNWTSGFYAYEEESTDPWGYSVGTGIKALPVFPGMKYTYTIKLWP